MLSRTRFPAICLAALVFSSVVSLPWSAGSRLLAHDPAAEMVKAANLFLASLPKEARAQAQFDWKDDKRQGWYFVPDRFIKPAGKRFGLGIGKMTPQQRLFAQGLLSAGLSHKGYLQSLTIMALEQVLHELENKNPIRDAELYYVSIFGNPSKEKTWAWRFEGHHLSVNFTLVDGKRYSVTPSFFGSNPAHVKSGPLKGTVALAGEEMLARQLVKSLGPEQRAVAVLSATAPRDILTSQDRKVNKGVFFPPKGIAFSKLNGEQQKLLLKLVNEYASKYREEVIKEIDSRIKIADGKNMFFAWAGGFEPGQGHYYRVQTKEFLFEYDCTQNNANHIHAVWRQFDGDFGEDLLAKHYERSPHHRDGGAWKELFDGKSLAGWKANESDKCFRVEDGVLVVNGPRSHLFYVGDEKPFVNFELVAEIKTLKNSNSGLYFHTRFQERGWPKHGFEAQINQTYNDRIKTGSLYGVANNFEPPVKDGEWFTMRIRVEGKNAKVFVNDKKITDYRQPEGAKAGRRFTRVFNKGTFAIQAHDPGSTVHFRKIRVRRL